MNVEKTLEDLLNTIANGVGASVTKISTEDGDNVAVVSAFGIISVGILESKNGRQANAVFTKDEAKKLSDALATVAGE